MNIEKYEPPHAPGPMKPRTATNRIIWHCTASPEGRDQKPDDLWRIHVEDNDWSHIGYHYLIELDGTIWECRPENMVGAGVSGHNSDSIHVSYVGGMNKEYTEAKDTRTAAQVVALYKLTDHLLTTYNLDWKDVHGHNEYAAKACPSFDVAQDIEDYRNHQEGGDPEPDMPTLGAIGLALATLHRRIQRLEQHNASWDDTLEL